MSTYNGESYLKEQIDSILAQADVDVSLIVRDDNSSDRTVDILQRYEKYPRFKWYVGENLGCAKSFMELLYNAPKSDFYAFSDQDDIWYPNKLSRAISWLQQRDASIPILYCGNQNCVDKDGNHMYQRLYEKDEQRLCLKTLIFDNPFSGCTMVFNYQLYQKIIHLPKDNTIILKRMHDILVIYVAVIYGEVLFDIEPMMDYRRHENNLTDASVDQRIGVFEKGVRKKFFNKVKKLFMAERYGIRRESAQTVLTLFADDLTLDDEKMVRTLAEYRNGWRQMLVLLNDRDLLRHCDNCRLITYFKVFIGWL